MESSENAQKHIETGLGSRDRAQESAHVNVSGPPRSIKFGVCRDSQTSCFLQLLKDVDPDSSLLDNRSKSMQKYLHIPVPGCALRPTEWAASPAKRLVLHAFPLSRGLRLVHPVTDIRRDWHLKTGTSPSCCGLPRHVKLGYWTSESHCKLPLGGCGSRTPRA
jgi:hypothetical protein